MLRNKVFYQCGIFGGLLLLLSIAYWPALTMRYAYHDSLAFFLDTDVRFLPPGVAFSFVSGRYLAAVFLTIVGRLVGQAQDLGILRFLSVLQLSLCGFLLVNFLRKNFLKPLESFLIVAILFTLPPFQIIVCQESMFFYPVSLLAAILSFLFCFDLLSRKNFSKGFFSSGLAALFFMIVSLCTYQSGAMFFWALAAIFVIFAREDSSTVFWKKILKIFFFGFLAMIIYRGMLEITKDLYLDLNPERNYDPYHFVVVNVIEKIKWFLTEPTVKVLNFWNIFPKKEYAVLFAGFILGGILLACLQNKKQGFCGGTGKESILKGLVLIPLLFLTSLPNILFPENIAFYRCYMALAAFFIFIFLWALLRYADFFAGKGRVLRICILCLLVCGGVAASYQTTLHYRARPSAVELKFLEETLQNNDLNRYLRIHFIQPNQAALHVMDDEYGNLTTSFGNDIIGFLSCGIRNLMKDSYKIYGIAYDPVSGKTMYMFRKKDSKAPHSSYCIILSFGPETKTQADFFEPTLIIDMNKAVDRIREE